MGRHLITILEVIAAAGAVAGIGYYLLCLWSARTFVKSPAHRDGFMPPVSILKPLRGTDPEIYDAFRSHCLQDYPEYEIIFGVSDPGDPAVELVEQLMREFPGRALRLVVCPKVLGANMKVSNLVQMLPQARYEYIIVNDSDIKVPHDYLRRVLAPLEDPKLGMVTCLYRGIAGATLGSKLESIGIGTDFAAGVLAARQIEGVHFALGSTMAFPRKALAAIGGYEALVDYLADDFELGNRISALNLEVRISDVVVDTHLPDYSVRGFFQHQLRWGRSTRDSRPRGYTGLVLTFGVPWAILALVLSRSAVWAWALLLAAMAVRLAMAVGVDHFVLRDRQLARHFWLIPLRDVAALLIWIGGYTGHTIAWRGDHFILEKGKLRPVQEVVVGR